MLERGFTLTELLVTMSLSAIVLMIAVPSFKNYVDNARLSSISNSYVGAIQLARTEAIKRGVRVLICPQNAPNGSACGGATDWKNGWMLVVDKNKDGQPDDPSSILRRSDSVKSSEKIVTTMSVISFDGGGFVDSAVGDVVVSAANCSNSVAKTRRLSLSKTGQITNTTEACSSS